jgi:hypothetical protein
MNNSIVLKFLHLAAEGLADSLFDPALFISIITTFTMITAIIKIISILNVVSSTAITAILKLVSTSLV